MTPASNPASRESAPINIGFLAFGNRLAESLQPATRPLRPYLKEARVLRLAGRLNRLLAWWTRPMPDVTGDSATDAATRLAILTRGGFQR